MASVTREQLIEAIMDADATCGPWCNDQRGECQRIAARAADAVLALLADAEAVLVAAAAEHRSKKEQVPWTIP